MTPCQRFKKHISSYIDGELDSMQLRELELHLKSCSSCRQIVSQLGVLRSRLRTLSCIEASEAFTIVLRDRIRREKAGKRRRSEMFVSGRARWIPAFGVGAIVLVAGFWMVRNQTTLFDNPQPSSNISRSVTPPETDFSGQIHYVIDDYTQPLSGPYAGSTIDQLIAQQDSLLRPDTVRNLRHHVIPVSF